MIITLQCLSFSENGLEVKSFKVDATCVSFEVLLLFYGYFYPLNLKKGNQYFKLSLYWVLM